jgi:hypothetical protein
MAVQPNTNPLESPGHEPASVASTPADEAGCITGIAWAMSIMGIVIHVLCLVLAISVGTFDRIGPERGAFWHRVNGGVAMACLLLGTAASGYLVAARTAVEQIVAFLLLCLYALAIGRYLL